LIWQIARDLVRPRGLEASSFLCAPTTESRKRLSDDNTGRREWQVSGSHFHQKIHAHPYFAYLSRICPATPQAFENRDVLSGEGGGFICGLWALQAPVIPAKAGIQCENLRKPTVDGLDSRFRGNDRRFETVPPPNDTSTLARKY
jgi:hypothetical protein